MSEGQNSAVWERVLQCEGAAVPACWGDQQGRQFKLSQPAPPTTGLPCTARTWPCSSTPSRLHVTKAPPRMP